MDPGLNRPAMTLETDVELASAVIMILAIGVGFFVQSLVGFAAALIAMPFLLLVLTLPEAVALMATFSITFSTVVVARNWKRIDKRTVGQLAVGILPGLVLGIYLLKYGNPVLLKKFLGVFVIAYIAYYYVTQKKIAVFNRLGPVFGLLGGFFGGMYSTPGPPYVTFISNRFDEPGIVRATIFGSMCISDVFRVPMLAYSDVLTLAVLKKALIVFPFFLLAIFLGNRLFHRVPRDMFINAIMAILFLSALSLIVR